METYLAPRTYLYLAEIVATAVAILTGIDRGDVIDAITHAVDGVPTETVNAFISDTRGATEATLFSMSMFAPHSVVRWMPAKIDAAIAEAKAQIGTRAEFFTMLALMEDEA